MATVLDNLNSNQLIVLIDILALGISDDLSADELNTLGNFIVALGSLLLAKAAQMQALQAKQDTINQIEDLTEQIRQLREKL